MTVSNADKHQSKSSQNITFCTVSFGDEEYIRFNQKLSRDLNQGANYQWLVGENKPTNSGFRMNEGSNLEIIEGASNETLIPSYHHTTTLNRLLKSVRTRFVCIIDPDFFILQKNWVTSVINHMLKNDLHFLGVPWHPKHHSKYRNFPCVHFMVIDLQKIPIEEIDFRPTKLNNIEKLRHKQIKASGTSVLKRVLANLLTNRWQIGNEGDTGSRLYAQYSLCSKYHLLTPVIRDGKIFDNPVVNFWNCSLDLFFAEKHRFKQKGSVDLASDAIEFRGVEESWELFFYGDKPFGIHLRNFKRNCQKKPEDDIAKITNYIDFLADELTAS